MWCSESVGLEILVQSRRNKGAALKLIRKLLKNQGFVPDSIVTGKLPSYGAALRELGLSKRHDFVAGKTIEPRIRIYHFDDESKR